MSKIVAALGLMSGTSMDGIDVALVRTDGRDHVEREAFSFYAYSASTRDLLEQALDDAKEMNEVNDRPGCLDRAEAEITRLHVDAVQRFLDDHKLQPENIDLIGFHGQTVMHRPDHGWTCQLGRGDELVKETGISCVYNMRANDMVNGGQGAPLVPVYHQALVASLPTHFEKDRPVVFVNIGGISNVTYVGEELIAFDAGPGNALIDQWVQRQVGIPLDEGGHIASEGSVKKDLVNHYLADPFLDRPIPKSLDRNDFAVPAADAGSVEDVARSLARVTAEAIFRGKEHMPESPKLWIVCGGGRHNPFILSDLRDLAMADQSQVISAEEAGFDGDAVEAEAWAYLAVRSYLGLPLTYPLTTGCRSAVTGGLLVSAGSVR